MHFGFHRERGARGPGVPVALDRASAPHPLCTRTCVDSHRGTEGRDWLAGRAAGTLAEAGFCAAATLWGTKSRRLPTAGGRSDPAHRLRHSDPGADGTASPHSSLPCGRRKGRQDSPLVTASQSSLGGSAKALLQLRLSGADRDGRCVRAAGAPGALPSCKAPVIGLRIVPCETQGAARRQTFLTGTGLPQTDSWVESKRVLRGTGGGTGTPTTHP